MSNDGRWAAVILGAVIGVCGAHVACGGAPQPPEVATERPVERFEFDSADKIEKLFTDLNYTPETWQAGIREVPRVYITDVPSRWRDRTSKEMPVVTKKRAFFRLLGPLVLHSNELIQADRDRAERLIAALRKGETVSPEDETFLRETAGAYKLGEGDVTTLRDLQDELLVRLDTIPPSLVLAQAAEESGWGTSRFAAEGNALFGMWTWGGEGITPLKQRSGLGNYKIAAYETPLLSVMGYMLNLNTHNSYRELRARRVELRRAGSKVTGWELAGSLTGYSERGAEYVDSLRSLMKVNMLQPVDDAYLGDGPTILLIPVGEGAE